MVEFFDPVKNQRISYHIDKKMLKLLEKVKEKINKKDEDYVMIVDGYDGSGKSTAAQQWGKYVDPTLDLSRICMTADEFKKAIINAKSKECVIYDEAVTGVSASESITRIGRLLKSMMMQMRQKNLFVIVIIPTVFELNKYIVLFRSRFLIHIYESNGRKGYFAGFNRKYTKLLYLKGKKTYSYKVRTPFTGRFYGKYVVNEQEYRKKKEEALIFELEHEENENKKWKIQRDVAIYLLKEQGLSYRDIIKKFEEHKCHISLGLLAEITGKVQKNMKKPEVTVQSSVKYN